MHMPHVVLTVVLRYVSGASGTLRGRPSAPAMCIPQKIQVVPVSIVATWIRAIHVGTRYPTTSSCTANTPVLIPNTAPSDST